LKELSEQVKELNEKTTVLQMTTDSIQSQLVLMNDKMGLLEEGLEDATETLNEVKGDVNDLKNDSSDVVEELGKLNEKLDTIKNKLPKTYRYEISQFPFAGITWQKARDYCTENGGDLAYHGLDTIGKRKEIICNQLNWCDHHTIRELWWGLRKRDGVADTWEYIDGTLATDDQIIWREKQNRGGLDCAEIAVDSDKWWHMNAIEKNCDDNMSDNMDDNYAFCEFEE